MSIDTKRVTELLAGATAGPWAIASWSGPINSLVIDRAWDDYDRRGGPRPDHDLMTASCARRGDAELIAAAPEIAEAYLAAVERASFYERQTERLEQALDFLESHELLREARPFVAMAFGAVGDKKPDLLARIDEALMREWSPTTIEVSAGTTTVSGAPWKLDGDVIVRGGGDWRRARGAAPRPPGGPRAEEIIRALRDGSVEGVVCATCNGTGTTFILAPKTQVVVKVPCPDCSGVSS